MNQLVAAVHASARGRKKRVRAIMRRREFLAGIGAASAGAGRAIAQQNDHRRRIGFLMGLAADDAEAQDRIEAFESGLRKSGWTSGRNLQIDYRRGAGDADSTRRYADEL